MAWGTQCVSLISLCISLAGICLWEVLGAGEKYSIAKAVSLLAAVPCTKGREVLFDNTVNMTGQPRKLGQNIKSASIHFHCSDSKIKCSFNLPYIPSPCGYPPFSLLTHHVTHSVLGQLAVIEKCSTIPSMAQGGSLYYLFLLSFTHSGRPR